MTCTGPTSFLNDLPWLNNTALPDHLVLARGKFDEISTLRMDIYNLEREGHDLFLAHKRQVENVQVLSNSNQNEILQEAAATLIETEKLLNKKVCLIQILNFHKRRER